jgi:hypothetical protein
VDPKIKNPKIQNPKIIPFARTGIFARQLGKLTTNDKYKSFNKEQGKGP